MGCGAPGPRVRPGTHGYLRAASQAGAPHDGETPRAMPGRVREIRAAPVQAVRRRPGMAQGRIVPPGVRGWRTSRRTWTGPGQSARSGRCPRRGRWTPASSDGTGTPTERQKAAGLHAPAVELRPGETPQSSGRNRDEQDQKISPGENPLRQGHPAKGRRTGNAGRPSWSTSGGTTA